MESTDTERYVPGTRYPIVCDKCNGRRRRLDDIHLVACNCISSFWVRLYDRTDGQGALK